ncbi:MAG TPA: hypothetical protein VHF89_15665, partial [Solirubrobacteraceae bacterium]|nr:hypothetical protein [Solirubrobacteraceae bacterium]
MNLQPTRALPTLAAVVAIGVPAAVAVAFAGGGLSLGGDEPTPREQWGGHGGEPAVATGPPDRVALDG